MAYPNSTVKIVSPAQKWFRFCSAMFSLMSALETVAARIPSLIELAVVTVLRSFLANYLSIQAVKETLSVENGR
jgi:hypothetical protein